MFDVKELNKKIKEIGIQKIAWIAEDGEDGNWSAAMSDDDNAKQLFGFDRQTETFQDNITEAWEGYRIEDSIYEGMFDIIFYGYGTAYQLD